MIPTFSTDLRSSKMESFDSILLNPFMGLNLLSFGAIGLVDILNPTWMILTSLPDAKAREEILNVHARNKVFGDDVNLKALSLRTPGFSGADLENLLNEAALLAVRRNKEAITMDEIDEATDRVLM